VTQVVFAISDNDLSISLKGNKWFSSGFLKKVRPVFPVFDADANNALAVYRASELAVAHARKTSSAAVIVYHNVPRRFGHAATDRQAAYLTASEIQASADRNPLASFCAQAVQADLASYSELLGANSKCRDAFDRAAAEPKLSSREQQVQVYVGVCVGALRWPWGSVACVRGVAFGRPRAACACAFFVFLAEMQKPAGAAACTSRPPDPDPANDERRQDGGARGDAQAHDARVRRGADQSSGCGLCGRRRGARGLLFGDGLLGRQVSTALGSEISEPGVGFPA